RLAIALLQCRPVVPGINRRRPAVHEQEDAVFRLRLEVRVLRRKRVSILAGPRLTGTGVASEETVLFEQRRQRQSGEARSRFPQELAAGARTGRGSGVARRHGVRSDQADRPRRGLRKGEFVWVGEGWFDSAKSTPPSRSPLAEWRMHHKSLIIKVLV